MRLFVAAPLTGAAAAPLAAWLHDVDLPGRVVPPENWHLTLRFLGTTDQAQYERLLASLDETDLGDPFEIRFGGLGGFPRPARATVAFVVVDRGDGPLSDLASVVDAACDRAGFGVEERPFHAHLTLSRIRPPADLRPLAGGTAPAGVQMPVTEVAVFQSHPGRGGVRYEVLDRLPLGDS